MQCERNGTTPRGIKIHYGKPSGRITGFQYCMPESNNKKYRLTLVHFWWSLLIILTPIFLPAGLMVLGIRLKLLTPGAGSTLLLGLGLMFLLGGYLLVRWRQLLPRYERTVVLGEAYIEIVEKRERIPWSDIRWYREDTNSPIVDAFVLGVKGRRLPLSWKVIKSGRSAAAERAGWEALRDAVLEQIRNKEIGAGNYYDTPTWRILAILLLLSNPMLWVSLYARGLPFDARLGSALLIWFGITSSMAGTVWYNRRLKSSDRSK